MAEIIHKPASAIASQFRGEAHPWDKREDAYTADIIINTTPIGREDNDVTSNLVLELQIGILYLDDELRKGDNTIA